MSIATAPVVVTDEHKKQYRDEGYCILERAIPSEQLQMLRDQCQHFIDVINAEMDAKGVTVEGINHRDKRYFVARRHKDSPELRSFLFGDLMAEVLTAAGLPWPGGFSRRSLFTVSPWGRT